MKIFNKVFNSSDSRSNLILKNIFGSSFLKVIDGISNYILVPLSLAYLTQTDYGIWLTINSIFNSINFFDLGISHGYRNKLAIAISDNNILLAKQYTSTAYFVIGFISLILAVLFLPVIPFVNWENALNSPSSYNSTLIMIMFVVTSSFLLKLSLKIITSVFLAHQMPIWMDLITTVTKTLTLILIVIAGFFSSKNLIVFTMIQCLLPLFIFLISTFIFFNYQYKQIKPSWKFFDKNLISDLFGLGIKFFLLQLSATILFATDNIIISHVLSPAHVAPYVITLKYFGVFSMIFFIVSKPYWSAFTDAFHKKEILWIRKSIKKLNYFVIVGIFFVVILFIFFDRVKLIWVGEDIVTPLLLVIQCALFVLLQSYSRIYTFFLNGVGKINLSLITGIFTLFVNIPLSIYFASNLNLGSAGVILATNFSLILYIITRKIQYNKIINNNAYGIWNK